MKIHRGLWSMKKLLMFAGGLLLIIGVLSPIGVVLADVSQGITVTATPHYGGPPDPHDPDVEAQVSGTEHDSTLDAKADTNMEIGVVGTSEVVATLFNTCPSGATPPIIDAMVQYQDAYLYTPSGVTEIVLRLYFTDAQIQGVKTDTIEAYWWTGSSWDLCSDQTTHFGGTPGYAGYVEITINSGTSPDLDDLNGRYFGIGGEWTEHRGVYLLAAVLPYVFISLAILAVLGMVVSGYLLEGLILAVILSVIGIVGTGLIQSMLDSFS